MSSAKWQPFCLNQFIKSGFCVPVFTLQDLVSCPRCTQSVPYQGQRSDWGQVRLVKVTAQPTRNLLTCWQVGQHLAPNDLLMGSMNGTQSQGKYQARLTICSVYYQHEKDFSNWHFSVPVPNLLDQELVIIVFADITAHHRAGPLTHWGRDKMDAIFQTTFSITFSWMKNTFSWMKMHQFWLRFHWSLFN